LEAPPAKQPRTQENTREKDDTIVTAEDEEVLEDEALDEFAEYFSSSKTPKIYLTTSVGRNKHSNSVGSSLLSPNGVRKLWRSSKISWRPYRIVPTRRGKRRLSSKL
jgi:hypothetical protein